MKIIDGGVTAAKGFKAASTAAEIKYKGRTDMAMVFSEVPCVAAGTFTTNVVKAAPVRWDQDIVYNHPGARAVICNSGIANACTVSYTHLDVYKRQAWWYPGSPQQKRGGSLHLWQYLLHWWSHPGSVSSASSEERGQYRDAASGLRKHWSRPVQ